MRAPDRYTKAAARTAGKVWTPETFIKHDGYLGQTADVFRYIPEADPSQFLVTLGPAGPVWSIKSGLLPLQPYQAGFGQWAIRAGTINGIVPTLGGLYITNDPPPTFDPGLEPFEVWATLNWTLTWNHSWLAAAVIDSVQISTGTEVPASDGSAGTYRVPLASFRGGKLTGAFFTRSGSFQPAANGEDDSVLITLQM